ncbi:MAG: InlB B-repeat-containing protein, partial [Bacilli bacterium]|nr:InlB B-repeat-containing protein [Bacilli bacterium]
INEGSEYHKEELTYKSKHEKIEDPFKTGYTFIGWYNENEEKVEYPITVTKDITLHSKYEINKYTVTFNDEDRITTKEVNYNNKVEPVINQGKEGYTFKYWSTEENGEEYNFNTLVTEDTTLYAVYEINTYTVTFKNYDGSILQEETLNYGSTPTYKGNVPTREKTKEYTYTFKGWDKEITEVTNNQEYIATYTEIKNKYNVKFTNYDGSILQEESLEYGSMPVYKGETPTREKTEEYTYTFKSWNKEITEVTDNEIYIATYTEVKNKYTVIYMDGETEYTRKEVNYGETVSEEVITKAHNIYIGWTIEGRVYDFSTPITQNITIQSSFELVENPVIESTPIEWTKEDVRVRISSNHTDYEYMYKIDDGEYQEYTGEFTVDKNCIVVAKSIKENIESEVTTKEITNIDKVLPEIKEITEENITTKSIDIKVKGQDNESGLSEIRIYKNEELMVSYPYTERLNEEKEETYSLTGLEENTTYKIKVELIDKVGNINVSEEKEITTLKRIIVSRIIGRNNSLYEREEDYELFESLEEAVTSCGSNECTIEMVLDTLESVNVLEGQEIKLELNGKTVTGVRDYTIENSGELIIVDKEDSEGGIINNTDTAIKNIGNGILQIGENEEPLSVSTTKPNIVGTTYGIYTEVETSKLKFYDGKIEGNVAIQGNVDDTPYLYNAKITNEGHQVATLSILAEAEAKITGGKYYTKLSNAVSETKSGPGTYTDKEENLLQSAYASSYYTFNYDEETNSLVSNNQNQRGTTAYSYIKIDLTDYTVNQELTVSAKILASNSTGCVHLNTSKENVSQNTTDGRLLYMTGNQQDTAKVILQKGKIYYLHFSKSRSWADGSSTDIFSITDVTLNDYKVNLFGVDILDDIVTPGTYGFVNEFGKLKSNNKGTRYTSANSYLKVDLTNYVEDQKIYIDAEISSGENNDFGYVTITDSEIIPEYNSETGRVVYISGNVSSKVYEATLIAGKINYIHIGYKKTVYYGSGLDTFTINGIYTSIDKGDISQNITTKVPVLNEKVDTVELIKDITLASKIEIPENKEMVLDLKGYTLTTSSNDYVIKNSGDLTIIDSKYSDEQDKNQSDYEAEQAKYDEEYNAELSAYNKAKTDYEKSVEEYNKKLEEYYASHPGDDFEYTGEEETYVVPQDGTYELETWGAQGGTAVDSCDGGYGGYSYGQVELKKGDILYINVGGVGTCNVSSSSKGGYNGGGDALSRNNYKMCSGGGATHIATKSGLLKTLSNSTDSILIVSGSGGGSGSTGSSCSSKGGSGGGISGTVPKNNCSDCGTRSGGTQTSGGRSRFGTGDFGCGAGSTTSYSVGGGSGFYGGAGDTFEWGATGGSGYIGNSKLTSKKMYCYDCTESSDESTKTISTTNVSETPTENNAKKGNGYAKITLLGSNNSDSTIEKPTKPEEPEILKITDVELETSNFTYSGNGRFTKGSNNLTSYVNDSGNKSVTYYNKKINVTSKMYAHVNFSLYQNYYSSGGLLGTAYIGFSKTNEVNTDDFVSYVERDITSYSGSTIAEDIDIPIEESGEYYFKIVLYHNANASYYTVYSDLYSLSFDHKPVLKKAILKKAAMTGTITSTTNSVIYNDLGANLTIKDGNMVLNKSGEYDIITNEGNISLFKDVVLNTKQANNRAIYNGYKGIIKNANMVINQDSSGYGIYNYSSLNNNFDGTTFNLSNGYAIFNRQSTLTVNNINVNGGTAYSNDSNLIINNSNLSTKISSAGNVEFNNTTLKYITSSSSDYVFNGIITINDSTFNLPWFLGNNNVDNSITINNSDINVNSSIGRMKNLYINNSTFNSISTEYNSNAIEYITNLVINNSTVNATVRRSEYSVIGNCENVEITGESVINNSYEGNTIFATNITVGEKDNKSSDYPKIQNGTGSGLKTNNLNIYDGTITTKKGLSILGSITEIEDSYKVNVVYNEDGTETLSLVEPTDVVAKIGEKKYTKLQDALYEVSDNETIYLLKNIYPIEAFTLSESKSFKIDLNSNEIRGFNSDKLFENSGTHEIIDSVNENKGTISNSGSYVLSNNGTLNLNNINVSSKNNSINNYGSITLDNTDVSASGGYLINNNKDGIIESTSSVFNIGTINNSGSIKLNDVTINDSIITNNENATLSLLKSRLENRISGGNKGITNSGVLTTEDCALKFYYGYVQNNVTGTYTTTNDTYTGLDDRYSSIQSNGILNVYGISTWNRIINRTDGLLNIYSGSYHIVNAYDNSKTNIYGGTLNGYISNEGANSVLNINAGTFNWGSTGSSSYVIENRSTGTVNIGVKDGTVDNDSIKISSTQKGLYNNTGTLNFYDGIVKGVTAIQGKVNDVEDGYDIVKETDGNLEVKYLGKVYAAQIESTGEKYYSIKEAIDAVTKDGEIIKLLRNITTFTTAETIEISDNKNVILDLNGYTINQGNKPLINNNGTLTLRDSSDTTTDSYGNVKYKGQIITSNGTIINNNGSFIFESGTITSDVQVDNLITNTNNMIINNGYVTVYGRSSDLIINSGILTINDGRFCTEHYIQSIVNNKVGATLTINGGKYYKNGDGIEITNEGTAYIYGGNFTVIENLIYNKETGVAKIDGLTGVSVEWLTNYGTMDISNSSIGENYMYNYGTLNLTDVTLLYGSIQNSNDVGEININGGTYNGSINANSGKLNIIDGIFNKNIQNWRGTVNIRGGSFALGVNNSGSGTINIGTKGDINDSGELNVSTDNPNITNTTYGVINTSGGIVNFYDGIISGTTDAINGIINEVEDGYEIISDTTDDGKKSKYLSRLPVAEVESTGDTYYTLQEAIDAATNSKEVIKLLRRFTTLNTLETTKVSEDKDIILDLNGYTLEQNNENFLLNNGTLKITDSSEDDTGKIVIYTNKSIENNGVMIIENINISVDKALSNLINNNDSLKVNNVKINSSNNISNFINNSGVLEMNVGEYSISNGTFIYNLSNGSITMDSITTTGNNSLIIVNNSGTSNNVKILNSNFSGRVINSESGTIVIDSLVSTSEVNNNKTGVINISNSNIRSVYNSNGIVDLNTVTVNGIIAEGSGTTNINGMILNSGSIVNRNSHVINIYDASVENDRISIYNNNAGSIINIYGGSFNSTKQNTVSNTGTINIYGGTITSTTGNSITNTGTVNIGSKDGNVSTEMPVITGKTYGVSNGDSGKVNFYDGIVSGESGAFYGTVNEVEPGYKIVTNKTDTLTSATLTLVGDDEKVAVLNGINFTSLQDAINSASDTNESIITLYKDVTFESNITVPANKNIKLYLNGYILNKGSYDFTVEGKITVIDGTSTNALANIMESVKEVLNIEGIKKNIIIYEMDDGSAISSESTYKLYKDNEEVMLEEDAIGIYSVGNSNDEIRSANNKIYINELPKGKYKLIGDNNKEVKFEIDESGKVIGNVKENTRETRKLVSTAVAELIIMIQTGIEKVNYIMIILTLLVTISSLLYIVKKTNVKES